MICTDMVPRKDESKDRGSHGQMEYARNEVRYVRYSHDDMKSHRCRLMSRIHGIGRRGIRGEVGNEDMELTETWSHGKRGHGTRLVRFKERLVRFTVELVH